MTKTQLPLVCPSCQQPFTPRSRLHRFCSTACRYRLTPQVTYPYTQGFYLPRLCTGCNTFAVYSNPSSSCPTCYQAAAKHFKIMRATHGRISQTYHWWANNRPVLRRLPAHLLTASLLLFLRAAQHNIYTN